MSLCSYYFELKISHNTFVIHENLTGTSHNERLEIPHFDICTPKTWTSFNNWYNHLLENLLLHRLSPWKLHFLNKCDLSYFKFPQLSSPAQIHICMVSISSSLQETCLFPSLVSPNLTFIQYYPRHLHFIGANWYQKNKHSSINVEH